MCETTFGTTFGGTNGFLAVTGAVSWAVTFVEPAVPVATATLVKLERTFALVQL